MAKRATRKGAAGTPASKSRSARRTVAIRRRRAASARKRASTTRKRSGVRAGSRRRKPAGQSTAQRTARKTAKSVRPAARRKRSTATSRKTSTSARAARLNAAGPPSTTTSLGPPRRSGRAARAKAPALDRQRRHLEEVVPTPPSSLDMNRHASAARTGRAELAERLEEHTETGPVLTGGDIDADWEEAYTSGDEAPGGDNQTPDQSLVDDIGRSLGVQYADNEELRGTPKIEARDRQRWELDPASSEDYRDRVKK